MALTSSPTRLIPTCVTHLPIFNSFYPLRNRPHPSSQAPARWWDGKRFVGLGYISISYEFYTRSRFAQCTNSSICTTAAAASSTLFLAHPWSSHSSTLFSATLPTENRGSLYTINTIVESRRHQLCSLIANPGDRAPRSAYG